MTTPRRYLVDDSAALHAYCIRHAVEPDAALTELVNMALGLPSDILDYLRDQRGANGAAA